MKTKAKAKIDLKSKAKSKVALKIKAKPKSLKSKAEPKAKRITATGLKTKLKTKLKSKTKTKQHPQTKSSVFAPLGFAGLGLSLLLGWYLTQSTPQSASQTATHSSAQSSAQTPSQVNTKAAPQVQKQSPLDTEFESQSRRSFEERTSYWSKRIVQNSNEILGQLASHTASVEIPDTAPLIPTQLDCTTYVETVVALAKSRTSGEFVKNLLSIRYKEGKPSYFSRNHFPEADWIPNNAKSGNLRDITIEVAQSAQVTQQEITKTIDRGSWYANQSTTKKGRTIASVSDNSEWSKPTDVKLNYLPLETVETFGSKIPSGAVIGFVRANHPNHPVMISHQAVITQESGKTFIHHANIRGVLKSEPLSRYIAQLRAHPSKSWPIIGVHIVQFKSM